jgi:hypothetical protein
MFTDLGRMLILLGVLLFIVGMVITLAGRIPGLGQLPGDIVIERENFRLYIPLGTMIVVSLLLTLILNLVTRLFR